MKDDLQKLVAKMQQGDRKAYETIYKRFAERMYYFSLKYLENESEAEEVTQIVFVKLWVKRKDLKDDLSLNSYLFMITKNVVIDRIRKQKREIEGHKRISAHQRQLIEAPDDIYEYQELSREINRLVSTLPGRRQQIYRLSREKGLSHKEIARELNISPKTVEVQIRLALQQIKTFLKKRLPSISLGGAFFLQFIL